MSTEIRNGTRRIKCLWAGRPRWELVSALIACCFCLGAGQSASDTWDQKKTIYQELIVLVGEISANAEDLDTLASLNQEFKEFYEGRMIFAESNDPKLLRRMMVLRKDLENQLDAKSDFYLPDKLQQSCRNLIKQLNVTIRKGDRTLAPSWLLVGGALLVLALAAALWWRRRHRGPSAVFAKLPPTFLAKIKQLIGEGETLQAIEELERGLAAGGQEPSNKLLAIKANFMRAQDALDLNVMDQEEYGREASKVNLAILNLLDQK